MPRIPGDKGDASIEEEKKSDQESSESIDDRLACFRSVSEEAANHSSHTPVVHRALSSSSLRSMTQNTLAASSSREIISACQSSDAAIPCRNLSEAFEELYSEPTDVADTPVVKQASKKEALSSVISPTGVADLHSMTGVSPSSESSPYHALEETTDTKMDPPHLDLHKDLKRDLSDALVDRVLLYAVIHDINKEASSMASHDDSGYNRNPDDGQEAHDPLVMALKGQPDEPFQSSTSVIRAAIIDEEQWLLETIELRDLDDSKAVNDCPPTFLQAMGEREYENPLTSLANGSRTQLWKPSRSWWEAKSGKNPWIEPASHNKRWRYLWPLIHYHKFLAKCIKKLKRNGIDVKTSVSPVSVFLREDVCAVSDHLAAVSLFDSERWMECLVYFKGWMDTSPQAEATLRQMIRQLKLRPFSEPGDVDSPLLRSQIDEHYLRVMAEARAQLASVGSESTERRSNRENSSQRSTRHHSPDGRTKKNNGPPVTSGPPPPHPRSKIASPSHRPTHRAINDSSPSRPQRPRYAYPPQHPHSWYSTGWLAQTHYGHYMTDDNSVQSGLSGESYGHPYDMNVYPGRLLHPAYYPPMMFPHPTHHHLHPGYDHTMQFSLYGVQQRYARDSYESGPTYAAGSGGSAMGEAPGFLSSPGTPSDHTTLAADKADSATPPGVEPSPYKLETNSPNWDHLDQATLAVTGIMTPQGFAAAQTPSRKPLPLHGTTKEGREGPQANHLNAQPLLLRQHQYVGAHFANREGYIAPSPATQFMMSPQSNFGYAYGGSYGAFSPSRVDLPHDAVQSPMASAPVGDPTTSKRSVHDHDEQKNADE